MRLLAWFMAFVALTALAEPDLSAPPLQELRSEWLREKAGLDASRLRAYRDMLEIRRTEAETEYQEKILARNVKGMSIARKMRDVCDEALSIVKTNGPFAVPGNLRRELEGWAKKLEEDKADADKQAAFSLAKLKEKYTTRLGEALARLSGTPAPPASELDALFETLLRTEARRPTPPPSAGGTNTPAGPTGATHVPPVISPWFASSGEGSNWFAVGRWTAAMMAQDIYSIPILNVTSSYQSVKEHPFSGQSTRSAYEVIRPLLAGDGNRYAYRLKRLPDRLPVSLLAWPSAENRGRLEFRTQPAPAIPSPHGFEIEASLIGKEKTAPVTLPVLVETEPRGAKLRLNGKIVVDATREAVTTPIPLRIPPGAHTLTLMLDGYVSKTFEKWEPTPGTRLGWKFVSEIELPPAKTIRLEPPKAWTPSELLLHIGDRLWIVPTGKWTIGRKGELCGPEGYPEGLRFNHYYVAGSTLRQVDTAPYGALLVRVGPFGDPIAVTNTLCLTVPATGSLYLDVNEKEDKELRRDNRGLLNVKLILIPFAP